MGKRALHFATVSHHIFGETANYVELVCFQVSEEYRHQGIGRKLFAMIGEEALLLVPEDKPFRGPKDHLNVDYTYHCDVVGTFEWFHGREIIRYKSEDIYECIFHGGLVE